MRNANHYARDRVTAALKPADRLVLPINPERGTRMFWANAELDSGNIQRLPDGTDVEECIASKITGRKTALAVHANHGRWIVECPCKGAQLVHPDDRRFMCVDCGNAWNNHRWCPVLWPDEWAEIEKLLDVRQQPLANYRFGETLEQLETENRLLKQRGLYR